MAFRLQLTGGPLDLEIRRAAADQAAKALEELHSIEKFDRGLFSRETAIDDSVHSARKALKKARSVARLARDALPDETYRAQNDAYRDAGRLLSPARVSTVMVKTLESVANDSGDRLDAETFAEIRAALDVRRHVCRQALIQEEDIPRAAIYLVHAAKEQIGEWTMHADGFEMVHGGLRRTYKRGRLRMLDAYADPSAERFHEWRKRVKYHWYHLRLLRQIWPEVMSAAARKTHQLASYLGDAHDLADLHDFLVERELSGDAGVDTERVSELLLWRQSELYDLAKPVGERVFAESPKRFMKRMRSYWRAAVCDNKCEEDMNTSTVPA